MSKIYKEADFDSRALRFILGCKKNCLNCIHLGWEGGELCDGRYEEGFVCYKRDYIDESKESQHLSQLDKESYRVRSKKCCEINLVAQSCSGCHVTEDGHNVNGEYDSEKMIYIGLGCDECEGHGWVYQTAGMM